MTPDVKECIIAELDHISEPQLAEVLAYVQSVSKLPKGTPPSVWREFIGCIPKEDLDRMEKVIEEEFRQVDYENW